MVAEKVTIYQRFADKGSRFHISWLEQSEYLGIYFEPDQLVHIEMDRDDVEYALKRAAGGCLRLCGETITPKESALIVRCLKAWLEDIELCRVDPAGKVS